MSSTKQESHNIFFDDQKPLCNKHTFPTNGDDTLTSQSVVIPLKHAPRVYGDSDIMEKMYADGFVWNPTMTKSGVIKYKFTRQTSIDHVKHFDNDPPDVVRAHHKIGLRIGQNIDVDNKYLPVCGITQENAVTKKMDLAVTKLAKHLGITYDEAHKIIG
jgi:hypothetical protein